MMRHACRLHFTAIIDIYIDLCSPVQPPGVGAVVAPSERNFEIFEAQIVDSEYITLMHASSGFLGVLVYFAIGRLLWQVVWCTLCEKKDVPEKLKGLLIYWAAGMIGIGVHLALRSDPLLANTSVGLGIAAGIIVASIIYMMTAAKIILLAYMHKQQDEHHEEVFT